MIPTPYTFGHYTVQMKSLNFTVVFQSSANCWEATLILFFLAVPGIQPKALWMLGKYCSIEPCLLSLGLPFWRLKYIKLYQNTLYSILSAALTSSGMFCVHFHTCIADTVNLTWDTAQEADDMWAASVPPTPTPTSSAVSRQEKGLLCVLGLGPEKWEKWAGLCINRDLRPTPRARRPAVAWACQHSAL